VALLTLWKKAVHRSATNGEGPNEGSYCQLDRACVAAWQVLTLTEPSFPNGQGNLWPLARLVEELQRDAWPEALEAIHHMSQWQNLPHYLRSDLNEAIALMTPTLWQVVMQSSHTDESLVDAALGLLWQSVVSTPNHQAFSPVQVDRLFDKLDTFPSKRIHTAVLGILSDAPGGFHQHETRLNTSLASVCSSLKAHKKDAGCQALGVKLLFHLVSQVANPDNVEAALLNEIAGMAIRGIRNGPSSGMRMLGSQILLVLLDWEGVARQCVMSRKGLLHLLDVATDLCGDRCDEVSEGVALSIFHRLSLEQNVTNELKHALVLEELVRILGQERAPEVKRLVIRSLLNLSRHFEFRQPQSKSDKRQIPLIEQVLVSVQDPSITTEYAQEGCQLVSILLHGISRTTSPGTELSLGKSKVRIKYKALQIVETLRRVATDHKENASIHQICLQASAFVFGGDQLLGELEGEPFAECASKTIEDVSALLRSSGGQATPRMLEQIVILRHVLDSFPLKRSIASTLIGTMAEIVTGNHGDTQILSSCFDVLACILSKSPDVEFKLPDEFLDLASASLVTESGSELPSHATRFLVVLTENDFQTMDRLTSLSSLHVNLVECLIRHPRDANLKQDLCGLLESQIVTAQFSTLNAIANQGGLVAIVGALLSHGNNHRIVLSGCRSLVGLLTATDVDTLWIQRELVAKSVHHALQCSAGNLEAASAALDAWHHLCDLRDYFKEQFVKSVPLLLEFMAANLTELAFQKTACSVLRMVASFGEAGKLAGSTETLSALLDALLVHCKSMSFVAEALALLTMLAGEESARSKLDGWLDVLVCIGRIHICNASILSEVIAASNNVAVDVLKRQVDTSLSPSLCQLVSLAMKEYPNHVGVQRNACLLLHSHTYNVASLECMQQRSEDLVPLLLNAGATFWTDCGDRTRYIVNRLESLHSK
jgi:hypothetical protein